MDGLTRYRRLVRDLRETARRARHLRYGATGATLFTAELCALKMDEAADAMSDIILALERMEDDGR